MNNSKGGMIHGPGTGTSDDIKKTVPSGTYIMPADSTKVIGKQYLDMIGQPKDINVSNGEYELSPEQVHAVGAKALEQMKAETHTPTGLPGYGLKSGKKPELFFRDGGLVPASNQNNELSKYQQPKSSGMRTISGTTADVNTGNSQPKLSLNAPSSTNTSPASAPTTNNSGGFGVKASNLAKGLGAFHGIGSMAGGAYQGFNTSTEDYATRLGVDPKADRGILADTAIRTAGVLSDVGNAASFGLLGNRFADKQINQARADADANMADIAKRRAERDAAQAKAVPAQNSVSTAPNFNDQLNDAMYGAPAGGVQSRNADPYAIRQKGNSFSYANPGAAAQARASGIPETQSSGIQRREQDPQSVANFMVNTREKGLGTAPVQAAAAQLQNTQNFGLRYPDRPQLTDEQVNERNQLMRDISAPIKGSRGLTANQRAQMLQLNQGDQNREVQMYNTDANNATSMQNNTSNNAASILQTGMREDGQNLRHGASLNQNAQQFNANFGLQTRQQNLNEKKEGFGIRQAERIEKLNEMYDKAKTDEQRQSIVQRINRLTGVKEEQESNPYIKVKRSEMVDSKGNVVQPEGEVLFNYKTGQAIDPLAQMQTQPRANSGEYNAYGVYKDAGGNSAYFDPKTEQFKPIPE
ncbi:hypothetical protein ABEF82_14810 [Acinetobacter thermotolerans]|uniref:hypothetical protein n=1 Tax=Acinetobacter thermotolerans TaxID=3151487 RepID=UPI00325B051A